MRQTDHNTVEVLGAKGRPASPTYKVSATYFHGYRCSSQLTIVGIDAVAKARRTGEAIIERTEEMLQQQGLGDYTATNIEVLGAESAYGPMAQWGALATREAVLRLTVQHKQKSALALFAREVAPAGTSFSPGTTGAGGGRSSVSPSIRQYAFLWDKQRVSPLVRHHDGRVQEVATQALGEHYQNASIPPSDYALSSFGNSKLTRGTSVKLGRQVKLIDVAYARSGDKGDTSNIGVIARQPQWVALLREQLTESAVAQWLKHTVKGSVVRYELPGINAFNFVCERALGGGGMASLRNDALGKGMAQILLSMPVWLDEGALE
jgi:hypothetical protein